MQKGGRQVVISRVWQQAALTVLQHLGRLFMPGKHTIPAQNCRAMAFRISSRSVRRWRGLASLTTTGCIVLQQGEHWTQGQCSQFLTLHTQLPAACTRDRSPAADARNRQKRSIPAGCIHMET